MVGLAALALLSGLFIAGANLLDGLTDDDTAAASATPAPSNGAEATRTPRPSPTLRPLRELTVVPGTPQPEPVDPGIQTMGWLEVISEVGVRGAPQEAAQEHDRLPAGTVLLVLQDQATEGWVQMAEIPGGGWIKLTDASDEPAAVFHPIDDAAGSGGVLAMAAGPDGLLAFGWESAEQNQQWNPRLFGSSNGERWTVTSVTPELAAFGVAPAWGPSGWIAVASSGWSPGVWIWESYDGLAWDALGALPPTMNEMQPSQVVGSDRGYLVVFDEYGSRIFAVIGVVLARRCDVAGERRSLRALRERGRRSSDPRPGSGPWFRGVDCPVRQRAGDRAGCLLGQRPDLDSNCRGFPEDRRKPAAGDGQRHPAGRGPIQRRWGAGMARRPVGNAAPAVAARPAARAGLRARHFGHAYIGRGAGLRARLRCDDLRAAGLDERWPCLAAGRRAGAEPVRPGAVAGGGGSGRPGADRYAPHRRRRQPDLLASARERKLGG